MSVDRENSGWVVKSRLMSFPSTYKHENALLCMEASVMTDEKLAKLEKRIEELENTVKVLKNHTHITATGQNVGTPIYHMKIPKP